MKGKKIVSLRRSKILAEVGGAVDESSVTLVVYGRKLNPEHVTKLLGVSPTQSFKRGYRKQARARPEPHGAWFLELRGMAPTSPEALIRRLLMKLPTSEEVWKRLRQSYKLRFALRFT